MTTLWQNIMSGVVTCVVVIALCMHAESAFETLPPQPSSEEIAQTSSEVLLMFANVLYRSGMDGEFRPLTSGAALRSGDQYKLIFTPAEACYVYVFQVDAAKKIYQLFPMERYGALVLNHVNPVAPGATYYLPAQGKSFVLDDQIGSETIYFLASRERDVVLEEQYQHVAEIQASTGDLQTQLEELDRLLEYALRLQDDSQPVESSDEEQAVTWEEEGEAFSVLQRRLENMCDGCVYVITFEHQQRIEH